MKLKGRKREVRSSPDDVAKLFSHTHLYLMWSQILHLVIEFFLRAVPWHGSLGTSRARKAVSGQGFQNTFAVAHEICFSHGNQRNFGSGNQGKASFVIILHQRSSEPAKEKTAGICTSEELLLVAGRPVSPAYSVIAATLCR